MDRVDRIRRVRDSTLGDNILDESSPKEREWACAKWGCDMTLVALRPFSSKGHTLMDRITESLLNEFSKEHGIAHLHVDRRFEHFSSYITVRRHFSETFDTADIITGSGGDTGIDGIAVLVNGSMITDLETLEEQASRAGYLDVTFVFIQARKAAGFDAASIGNFGFGVADFFAPKPRLPRNEKIQSAAEIMSAIYERSSKFKRGNPVCRLYYATTGKWQGDQTLEARRSAVISDLEDTQLFREVEFMPVDAERLHKFYRQTRNAISKEFNFNNKTVVPDIPGVKESYLGFLPAGEFLKLLQDESGEMLRVLFYDNVRDWLDFNQVNDEIKSTLDKDKARFVLMNNGITIIARNLQSTGNKFLIEDYSIVNGCQTSHVIFEQREKIDDSVIIPLRLIHTQDEDIINSIVRATNRQTEVKAEQFYALQEFPKDLERFFQTYDDPFKLYYERRTRQYDRLEIEKTRIVTPANMIKAFAAMFLSEPHRTTRSYALLKNKVSSEIFVKGHRMEPYYCAAFTLYKLEYLFRSGKLEGKYKPARFHILLAARILANPSPMPSLDKMNSREMAKYADSITQILWDATKSDELLTRAAKVVDDVADDNYHRDNIRTEQFTLQVVANSTNGGTHEAKTV